MYSESDIQSAVEAGAISADAADALRGHVATLRSMPPADEEGFRLISGFNDIFVSIACLLVIFAAGSIGGTMLSTSLGGALVAVSSWLMAEAFTRRRRMALPSIILLLACVIGTGIAGADVAALAFAKHPEVHSYIFDGRTNHWTDWTYYPWQNALMTLAGAVCAALAALVHWLRFHVAITIAAAVGALALLLLAAVAAISNTALDTNPFIAPAALICGLCVFIYAMRWDISDRKRTTQRSDIAFWLHLVAAPLIAHPLFYWMGVTAGAHIGWDVAAGILAIYTLFAVIALTIDRRALLVSALIYVLTAISQIFRDYGALQLNLALTTLVIGSALLLLSAGWHVIRRRLIRSLPARIQQILPPAD